jgi:integrase
MSPQKFYLYKRPNGYWYIGYWQDGRRLWKSADTKMKPEALKVLRGFEDRLKQDVTKITFREFTEQFRLLQKNSLRGSTISRIYTPAFNSFERICGNKLITLYSLRDVETFKRVMLEEKRTPVTVNIQFRSLRAAFNMALKWQMLGDNPFGKSSQLRVSDQGPVHLSKHDFQKLVEAVQENELKQVFFFAALTGLRLGEILNLTWDKIDLHNQQIVVSNSQDFLTKTGKHRSVPMNRMVYAMLSQMKPESNASSFVFLRKGHKMQHSYVSHKFKAYVRLLGIPENIHFHSLRHTFATWLVQGGVNIYEVQKLLGHSSVKVTEVYSHLAASELHSSVNRIDIHGFQANREMP